MASTGGRGPLAALSLLSGATLAMIVACTPAPEPPRATTTSTAVPATDGGSSPSTAFSAADAQLGAVQGRWSGDAGTIVFRNDGGADMAVRICAGSSATERFGFTLECAPTTVSGQVSVGEFDLILAAPNGSVNAEVSMYVDPDRRLHIGSGHTFAMSPQREGVIEVPGQDPIAVRGDTCVRADPSRPDATVPEPCDWRFLDGVKVLTVGGTTYLFDEAAGVVTSPSAYFTTLRRG